MSRIMCVCLELTTEEWRIIAEKLHSVPGFADVSEHVMARIEAIECEDRAMSALKDRQARYYGNGSESGDLCTPRQF